MHFIDEAKICLISGNGGPGSCSFRREKFIEFGGPDGGNGGAGGSIILRAANNLNTLIDFRYRQHFKAQSGTGGSGCNRTGASGNDIVISIPLWTQIYDEDGINLLHDMSLHGQEIVIACGGDGGFGNASFKSSTNRAPRRHTTGWPGKELWVWLKLKLLSDVGLLGMPNAGKSTFLSVVSAAKPKIGSYPFTTLKPQLGMVHIDDYEFVMADIPGLIEGASDGYGLGHKFLKHLERCKILLHVIDITNPDFLDAYQIVRAELTKYSDALAQKPELIVLNKSDAMPECDVINAINIFQSMHIAHNNVSACSAVTSSGIKEVLYKLKFMLLDEDEH